MLLHSPSFVGYFTAGAIKSSSLVRRQVDNPLLVLTDTPWYETICRLFIAVWAGDWVRADHYLMHPDCTSAVCAHMWHFMCRNQTFMAWFSMILIFVVVQSWEPLEVLYESESLLFFFFLLLCFLLLYTIMRPPPICYIWFHLIKSILFLKNKQSGDF